jgi:HEAT repeats
MTMNAKKILAAFGAAAIIGSSFTSTALAAAASADANAEAEAKNEANAEAKDERSEREADLYEQGTDAIDEEQWDEAIRAFTKVAELKGSRADGAVYWSAYALKKLGRRAEALKTLEAFKKAYASSRWLDDANALELELRQAGGERVSPDRVEDADLKMIAINSLMNSDPEKAFPLLEKIVHGKSDKKIRERALFILSQSESPRAQALLGEIAQGKANPDLQREAVRYLGMSGNAQSAKLLADMYASAASVEVKKEILRAFMIAGDTAHVVTAARSEKDADLRSEAIRTLGIMGGRAELASMYGTESNRDVRGDIIQAIFLSGDSEKLGELARGEKDVELRSDAIQKLGMMGTETAPLLLKLYAAESNIDVKEAVIQALFLQGNARALIDLSKKETNRQLRREALQKLSLMNDDEALQYMLQILNE